MYLPLCSNVADNYGISTRCS